ncbi:hypothetical protein C8R44DRAFT_364017 [Mycena epipterygia]|nr:hypothetical protein C8R44DRAFT_364017 [Mycena epipterygia]
MGRAWFRKDVGYMSYVRTWRAWLPRTHRFAFPHGWLRGPSVQGTRTRGIIELGAWAVPVGGARGGASALMASDGREAVTSEISCRGDARRGRAWACVARTVHRACPISRLRAGELNEHAGCAWGPCEERRDPMSGAGGADVPPAVCGDKSARHSDDILSSRRRGERAGELDDCAGDSDECAGDSDNCAGRAGEGEVGAARA